MNPLSHKPAPNSDAALREKLWLPRPYARQAIAAALEFQRLLDMQPSGGLRDPDGDGDALHGVRYKNAMVMLLTAVSSSLTPPPRRPEWIRSDIAGIFALLAAEEFKYLLDVQAPGSVFIPGGWRKRHADIGQSAAYARAAGLLGNARLHVLHPSQSHDQASAGAITVRCTVSSHAADAAQDVVQLGLDIDAALLSLGFKLADQRGGSAEHGRLFEIRAGGARQVDEVLKAVDGEEDAVHGSDSEMVDGVTLCHGSSAGREGAR